MQWHQVRKNSLGFGVRQAPEVSVGGQEKCVTVQLPLKARSIAQKAYKKIQWKRHCSGRWTQIHERAEWLSILLALRSLNV